MPKRNEELVVITKVYDLILWSCHHTGRFLRQHRFVLGERIERSLSELLETLIQAKYQRERSRLLDSANMELEVLRFQIRLAKDLQCIKLNKSTVVQLESADSPTPTMRENKSMNQPTAIEIWKEKLEHLRVKQAKGDDSFKTKKEIEEAEAQIAKLTAAPENTATPRAEKAEVPSGYLDWLKRQCADLDVFGLKLKEGRAARVNNVYVSLATRQDGPPVSSPSLGRRRSAT